GQRGGRWNGESEDAGQNDAREESRRGNCLERQGALRGPEGSPVRIPARLQQDLALALVRRQGLREAAARGSRLTAGPQEAVLARRRVADRDRACGEQPEDPHLYL